MIKFEVETENELDCDSEDIVEKCSWVSLLFEG